MEFEQEGDPVRREIVQAKAADCDTETLYDGRQLLPFGLVKVTQVEDRGDGYLVLAFSLDEALFGKPVTAEVKMSPIVANRVAQQLRKGVECQDPKVRQQVVADLRLNGFVDKRPQGYDTSVDAPPVATPGTEEPTIKGLVGQKIRGFLGKVGL